MILLRAELAKRVVKVNIGKIKNMPQDGEMCPMIGTQMTMLSFCIHTVWSISY